MSIESFVNWANNGDKVIKSSTYPFVLGNNEIVGYVEYETWEKMRHCKKFELRQSRIHLIPEVDQTVESRVLTLKQVICKWRDDNIFISLKGWRNELYPIYSSNESNKVLAVIERAAAPIFGIRTFGTHLNGYIHKSDGEINVWIARRSKRKQTNPGMLDNTVGGGLSAGISPRDNIIKESYEEASIPKDMAMEAVECGYISLCYKSVRGLVLETNYVYDLEFDSMFVPKPNDQEVETFFLWNKDKIIEAIKNKEFTPDAGIVMLDFLVRHKLLSASEYKVRNEIVDGLPGPKNK